MTKIVISTRGTSGIPEFSGSTWVRLQYLLGLKKLGVECFWVDHLRYIDPLTHHHSLEYLVRRFDQTAQDFSFQDQYCIVYNDGEHYFGMKKGQFIKLTQEADLLISVSGHLPPTSPLINIPRRAYIDVDPGFVQIWAHELDMGFDHHNFFFTVGQNVGYPEFTIPTHGIDWHPIVPPVVLEQWPPHIDETYQRISTIADWRGSQNAYFEGVYYGGKRDEFIRFLNVPLEVQSRIELALFISQCEYEDLRLLAQHKWHIEDPVFWAGDPYSYREFIQTCRAEFSVAKHGYVQSNSGWISDRTVCYLASGKPALVQSTGFEGRLPTGKGLLTFRTVEEAIAGIQAINDDYLAHCHAARQIAEAYCNSDIVLGAMLEQVGL